MEGNIFKTPNELFVDEVLDSMSGPQEERREKDFFKVIVPLSEKLPAIDKLVFDLRYLKKAPQKIIARTTGVTQGAVSLRLTRMKKKLKFQLELSCYDIKNIRKKLRTLFDPFVVELLVGMLETTCQTDTAQRLNQLFNLSGEKAMNQVKVRHRFKKYLMQMKTRPDEPIHKEYIPLFELVDKNLYALNEVKLPSCPDVRRIASCLI